MEALIADEDAMDKGVVDTVKDHKRKHDDDDDQGPSVGPNQGKQIKRRRTKESESSKKPSSTKETPKGKTSSKSSKPDPLTSNDLMATPIDFSSVELEYHFQEWFNALTDRLDWNNPEGDHYPFDLSKPLPLQGHPCHLTVSAGYLFNDDLEYLKSSNLKRTYTTSMTKTKAVRYDIEGIGDMIPMLWSPTKVRYDKDALKGSNIRVKVVSYGIDLS
nr:hypothetical protein [Tanacetum cinerariifolium]